MEHTVYDYCRVYSNPQCHASRGNQGTVCGGWYLCGGRYWEFYKNEGKNDATIFWGTQYSGGVRYCCFTVYLYNTEFQMFKIVTKFVFTSCHARDQIEPDR